jgi:hypothetical protein
VAAVGYSNCAMLANIRPIFCYSSDAYLGRAAWSSECAVYAKGQNPTLDPATAPPRKDPQMGEFWTLRYSVAGALKSPA